MNKYIFVSLSLCLIVLAFFAGSRYSGTNSATGSSTARKILYYVDPMKPGNRYDKPGTAPCGMALELVYSGGGAAGAGMPSMPAGTVRISPEKQQLIGVRVEEVEEGSSIHEIRLPGKVAADETRSYRINAGIDGLVVDALPFSVGSFVRKNQTLASFTSPGLLDSQLTFILSYGSLGRLQAGGAADAASLAVQAQAGIQKYEDTLRVQGMGDVQIQELKKNLRLIRRIDITSPATGFILARNISGGQSMEKGAELYRIADLSRVWILVDTYENDARYFHPGQAVPVLYQGKTFYAKVSQVLPEFDPSTRTLKVRLEMNNAGYVLRPGMFVDVDFGVRMPPSLTVPADAVMDSGLKKIVFVDRGNGFFEPRQVETGRWFDDRVEILRGLRPSEKVVVSGNFLIDSESRMKTATAAMSGTGSIDPSCGMMVDEGKSKSEGLTSEYKGKTYYFCSTECKMKFDKSPGKYAERPAKPDKPAGPGMKPEDMKNGGQRHD